MGGEREVIDDKFAGVAVAIGARISDLAEPGEVLISETVKGLVMGSGFQFTDRGKSCSGITAMACFDPRDLSHGDGEITTLLVNRSFGATAGAGYPRAEPAGQPVRMGTIASGGRASGCASIEAGLGVARLAVGFRVVRRLAVAFLAVARLAVGFRVVRRLAGMLAPPSSGVQLL